MSSGQSLEMLGRRQNPGRVALLPNPMLGQTDDMFVRADDDWVAQILLSQPDPLAHCPMARHLDPLEGQALDEVPIAF
jgi:hypothetical protein